MKNFFLPLLILLLLTGFSFAQMNEDSVLVVPKTSIPPVIDGELDTLAWNYVGETLCITMDAGDAEPPFDWFDLFGSLRMMFDDEYLYVWLYVQDDIINDEGGNHEYDGVELYFDADNSKTEGAFDGFDDIQMRFNVGETTIDEVDIGYGSGGNDWGFVKDGIEYVVLTTDFGWNLEAAIPLADLQLMQGELFGFDAQINDADDETRENMYRWWANDNNEWTDASLFGTAFLDNERVLSEYLEVPKGSAPTIDGEMADDEWDDAIEISGQRLDASQNLFEHVWGWEDCRDWGWLKWDDTNFYYYLRVWDDWYDITEEESGEDWEYDSVELFFDGDNSDTAPYDGFDDIQIRFNLGQAGPEAIDAGYGQGDDWGWVKETTEYVVVETERGWDVEAAIPLADMQIPIGMDFGFEWQLNDCDDPDTEPNRTVYRWWAPSEPTWRDASMFGTVVLKEGMGVEDSAPAVSYNYELSQNYPNPFNPSTNIAYTVPSQSKVTLAVYDLLGKQVARLVDEVKPAGQYTVTFDAHNLTSGIYFYKLNNGENVLTRKMTLMK